MASTDRPAGWPTRRITDPRELRALAHPTRMALLDLVIGQGPLTATQCAERIGESPASCSYHLRQLARYGHVEEAPGGRGRERPWRGRTEAISWLEEGESPALHAAGRALSEVVDEHRFAAWRAFSAQHDRQPAEWRRAALSTDAVAWLRPEELADISRGIEELWQPYYERSTRRGERPAGSRPVHFFAYAFPSEPVVAEDTDA
jgi:DNA-binding transcriptional ArsR family regulator